MFSELIAYPPAIGRQFGSGSIRPKRKQSLPPVPRPSMSWTVKVQKQIRVFLLKERAAEKDFLFIPLPWRNTRTCICPLGEEAIESETFTSVGLRYLLPRFWCPVIQL